MNGFTIVFKESPRRSALGVMARERQRPWAQRLTAERVFSSRATMNVSRIGKNLENLFTAEAGSYAEAFELLKSLEEDPFIESPYIAPPRSVLVKRTSQTNTGNRNAPDFRDQIFLSDAMALPQWKGSDAVQVTIVDSGVDIQHPQLNGIAMVQYLDPAPLRPDILGHGSHVAGLIAATPHTGNKFEGIATSVTQSVMHCGMSTNYNVAAYYRALRFALETGRLINLSLGGEGEDPTESDLISDAIAAGKIVVAAMGNSGEMGSPTFYPAAYPDVLAVGSVDANGIRSTTSNEGEHILISAPGENITSTVPTYPVPITLGQGTPPLGPMSGTSMATPIVTGVVARMLSFAPALTRTEIFDLVRECHSGNWSPEVGWGVINARALLSAL